MRVVFLAAALWASVSAAKPSSTENSPPGVLVAQAAPASTSPTPSPPPAAAPAPAADAPVVPVAPPSSGTADTAPPAAAQFSGGNSASISGHEPTEELTHFGAMLDVGIPDGLGLSVLWRPLYFLRINAGPTYNLLGFGVRGGVSIIPFYFFITPSLNLDIGHYFDSDASKYAAQLVSDPSGQAVLAGALAKVSYDYGNLHLGLEVGSPHRFLFFLRGGLTYFQTTLRNFQGTIQAATGDATITAEDPTVRAVIPSLKLGFILYL